MTNLKAFEAATTREAARHPRQADRVVALLRLIGQLASAIFSAYLLGQLASTQEGQVSTQEGHTWEYQLVDGTLARLSVIPQSLARLCVNPYTA